LHPIWTTGSAFFPTFLFSHASAVFSWFLFEAPQGQIAGQKVDIKVFDANMILRNVLIGSSNDSLPPGRFRVFVPFFRVRDSRLTLARVGLVRAGRHTLDLEWIHSQKNHEIFAKWLLLSNPDGKNPGSTASFSSS
jgi:hypothetical protein